MTAPPGEGGDRAELEHLREEQARWLKLGAEWHQELAGLRAENERLGVALDVVTRRNGEPPADPPPLPEALPSGPFTSTEEWGVFWGGETPDDCAGFEVVSCETEALEDRQWRVGGGVARRSVLYGRWTVTAPPEGPPGTGCACYREPNPHAHDSDEEGDCLVCGCGRHESPEPKEGE